ncbi:selenocysteine-specific translation elongation factor [Paludifilum halophilum]|uniref:selenocysteine-specific translation elongation factor n=1 Tax=Paludifilum halophilum TaxID=1642702 RepID=UPI00113FE887|nr:selenocysteine-specific translation elongation factor [Paludifilum halophilum]
MTDQNYILGTAGHIDHGKTMLTQALTGVDTDRLTEEKKRSISIEPGFAPLKLPSGLQASVIDVPGHERFIRQMVSGVAGIDYVLLVVAADDGVMPQTREHLSILNLLGVKAGLVVLTKIDRADPELLPLIEEDIRETTHGTFLEDAPILSVSSTTGQGIETLKTEIDHRIPRLPPRRDHGPFRLPVDRSFTVKGAGTVVTGTVHSGKAGVSSELIILPSEMKVKVRQAQVHGQTVDVVHAGQRAALNLTMSDKAFPSRGQTLVQEGAWKATRRMDIRAVSLPQLTFSLKQRSTVKVLIGTAEVLADLILYDRKEWAAGEEIYASLHLWKPVVAGRDDRFILRRPTPIATIGGGEVVTPYAAKHKVHPNAAEAIRRRATADLPERILDSLETENLLQTAVELARSLGESEADLFTELKKLVEEKRAVRFDDSYASKAALEQKEKLFQESLEKYHREHSMRPGLPKAEWGSRFLPRQSAKQISLLLDYWEERHVLRREEDTVALVAHRPSIPDPWADKVETMVQQIAGEGLTPSEWEKHLKEADLPESIREDLRLYLIRTGDLIPLTDHLLVHRIPFDKAVEKVEAWIRERGSLAMQEAKQLFSLSRKYLVPLLETMDNRGITRRRNNERVLASE